MTGCLGSRALIVSLAFVCTVIGGSVVAETTATMKATTYDDGRSCPPKGTCDADLPLKYPPTGIRVPA